MPTAAELEQQLEQRLASARAEIEVMRSAEQNERWQKAHAATLKEEAEAVKELRRRLDALAHEAALPRPNWELPKLARRLLYEDAGDASAQGTLMSADGRFHDLFALHVQARVFWQQAQPESFEAARELEARAWRAMRHRLGQLAGEIEPDRKR